VDERYHPNERGYQPEAVGPDRDTELEQLERQINRVPAEAIWARPDDHGGCLSGRHRRAGGSEFRNRVREQRYGDHDKEAPSGTASVPGRNGNGLASWISGPGDK
jgi:hypothetical protein